jgi:hypothetical protein
MIFFGANLLSSKQAKCWFCELLEIELVVTEPKKCILYSSGVHNGQACRGWIDLGGVYIMKVVGALVHQTV